ncbi:unnamed protein product [Ambrosiozyma monospora]|uniref:Unnamed protein product n=1 Tax=Ambrosiozyma monospora TaxID=43982 RepID=A0A9W7DHN8_AMBMO|nr:unnamed protein product [Ambrosiozyma monospora]
MKFRLSSKKGQILIFLTLFFISTTYFSILYIDTQLIAQGEEGIVTVTKTKIKNISKAKELALLYLNPHPGGKNGVTEDWILKNIHDENLKYSNEKQVQMEKEFERVDKLSKDKIDFKDDDQTPLAEGNSQFQKLMFDYLKMLSDLKLRFPHPERLTTTGGKPVIWNIKFMELPYDTLSESGLNSYMDFEDFFLKDLKLKHQSVINRLPDFNHTNAFTVPDSKGYVMIGGGFFTWFSYLSILALRKTGASLPLELMIPKDEDYEPWLCDDIFPRKLNVKCVLFSKVFGNEEITNDLKNYQIKSFALLATSFEHVFYLDSDNFAVKNPDSLLDSKLYQDYKMITWPDFWRRTTSPKLYDVLGIKVSPLPIRNMNDYFTDPELYLRKKQYIEPEDEVNYHDRLGTLPEWTTEAGQLIINKREHFKTLLLALYYNFDGPQGYHPLLSQGGAGEGDKETIVLAAHFLKKPYYQVFKRPTKLYGTFIKEAGWFADTTILQVDPITDYENLIQLFQQQFQKRTYVLSYP